MTKNDALNDFKESICGCFADVSLGFAKGLTPEGNARRLKSLAKRWGISRDEIIAVVTPALQDWLDNGFYRFHANTPQPWNIDPSVRRAKVSSMAIEAAFYLADR